MRFATPYPLDFIPAPIAAGSPGMSVWGGGEVGSCGFSLASNPSMPSSARVLTSLGMDVGAPRDRRGRPLPGVSELKMAMSLSYDTFFSVNTAFASALTASRLAILLEEFDSAGRFVRALNGGELTIIREEPWWITGVARWAPFAVDAAIPQGRIATRAGFFYRLWIDLNGEIRSAGFGGIGGSAAMAQTSMHLAWVEVEFVRP